MLFKKNKKHGDLSIFHRFELLVLYADPDTHYLVKVTLDFLLPPCISWDSLVAIESDSGLASVYQEFIESVRSRENNVWKQVDGAITFWKP